MTDPISIPVTISDYTPEAAEVVFRDLDPWDRLEGEVMRGAVRPAAVHFADWHAMQAQFLLSWVFSTPAGAPFAVAGAVNSGFAGVAQVAFLSRDHAKWRGSIARSALLLRRIIPVAARETGLHRLEARCLADHPTAGRFLTLLGFRMEARMPGYGATGAHEFRLFSWTRKGP